MFRYVPLHSLCHVRVKFFSSVIETCSTLFYYALILYLVSGRHFSVPTPASSYVYLYITSILYFIYSFLFNKHRYPIFSSPLCLLFNFVMSSTFQCERLWLSTSFYLLLLEIKYGILLSPLLCRRLIRRFLNIYPASITFSISSGCLILTALFRHRASEKMSNYFFFMNVTKKKILIA